LLWVRFPSSAWNPVPFRFARTLKIYGTKFHTLNILNNQNIARTIAFSALVIAVPLLASSAAFAGQVPTANSPAFEKPISFDAGISVEHASDKQESRQEKSSGHSPEEQSSDHAPEDCPEEPSSLDTPTSVDTEEHGSEPSTLESSPQVGSKVGFRDHQRVNVKVASDTFVYVARNSGDIGVGAATRINKLAAISAGIQTDGKLQGAVAVSPLSNVPVAVYAEYEREAMNYGVQYQLNNTALQAYYRPDRQAFGFGVSVNIGAEQSTDSAVTPVATPTTARQVVPPSITPLITPLIKPTPELRAPVKLAPKRIRG
jgi:hypothetical protein